MYIPAQTESRQDTWPEGIESPCNEYVLSPERLQYIRYPKRRASESFERGRKPASFSLFKQPLGNTQIPAYRPQAQALETVLLAGHRRLLGIEEVNKEGRKSLIAAKP